MHNNIAGQINQTTTSNVKQLAPADGWLKLKIMPKTTESNPKPRAVQLTRDVPLSFKALASRSMINMEIAHQEANPGADPLEFVITGTINIPGQNDDKEDFVF